MDFGGIGIGIGGVDMLVQRTAFYLYPYSHSHPLSLRSIRIRIRIRIPIPSLFSSLPSSLLLITATPYLLRTKTPWLHHNVFDNGKRKTVLDDCGRSKRDRPRFWRNLGGEGEGDMYGICGP